jgi:hypothetical protein
MKANRDGLLSACKRLIFILGKLNLEGLIGMYSFGGLV